MKFIQVEYIYSPCCCIASILWELKNFRRSKNYFFHTVIYLAIKNRHRAHCVCFWIPTGSKWLINNESYLLTYQWSNLAIFCYHQTLVPISIFQQQYLYRHFVQRQQNHNLVWHKLLWFLNLFVTDLNIGEFFIRLCTLVSDWTI